jgi:hypothetical protein
MNLNDLFRPCRKTRFDTSHRLKGEYTERIASLTSQGALWEGATVRRMQKAPANEQFGLYSAEEICYNQERSEKMNMGA